MRNAWSVRPPNVWRSGCIFNVLPGLPSKDATDALERDVVLLSQSAMSDAALCVASPYLPHSLLCQSTAGYGRPNRSARALVPQGLAVGNVRIAGAVLAEELLSSVSDCFELAKPLVADVAEEPSNQASFVVMVDGKASSGRAGFRAHGTDATLSGEHDFVLTSGEAELREDRATAVHGLLAPVLRTAPLLAGSAATRAPVEVADSVLAEEISPGLQLAAVSAHSFSRCVH